MPEYGKEEERTEVSIKVHIHKTHRQYTEGNKTVEVKGSTVGQCLQFLVSLYPGLKKAIFDDKGALKKVIEVYLNLESAYPDELKKIVKEGDEIHLTLIIAGG